MVAVDPLISPTETAFRLELTAAQLKVTHAALRSMLDDFGHDQPEVHVVLREVLAKLPPAESIRAISLDAEFARARRAPARSGST
jgi:hypothetical protein